MILEGIVTTVSPEGEVNVAPMGPHLPGLSADPSFPRSDPLEQFILKPFRGSRTYANLAAHGEGVLHVTDDVLLLAQSATGVPDPFPNLIPASRVRGYVLRDACRYAEFRVSTREEDDYSNAKGFVVEKWQIEDESAQGMRMVRAAAEAGKRMAHGQLIGVRPADGKQFMLAQVRWLMGSENGDVHAGVKLLPGLPRPLAVRPTGLNVQQDAWMPAIALSGDRKSVV